MNGDYESIHRRNGLLIKTNRSNDFYEPFKVAALWVSPIPLSGLFPNWVGDYSQRRSLTEGWK